MNFSTLKGLTIPEGEVVKITSNGTTLWEKVMGRIPNEYQEVEYVKADNNVGAYINLGFAFDTKAKIYLTQRVTSLSNITSYPFGAAENSGKLRCMISSPYGTATSTLYGSNGTQAVNTSSDHKAGDNEFEMILETGKLQLKNITTGTTRQVTTQKTYTMASNLYLFAQNYNGSARFGNERIIKAFKYYDKTDTLICDLVPCYRKSDGVIGMYDLVSTNFFTNVGTGSFTKGADV